MGTSSSKAKKNDGEDHYDDPPCGVEPCRKGYKTKTEDFRYLHQAFGIHDAGYRFAPAHSWHK